jgi:hypothetical protein
VSEYAFWLARSLLNDEKYEGDEESTVDTFEELEQKIREILEDDEKPNTDNNLFG